MTDTTEHQCSCPCGASQFTFTGKPIARFICHCKICQKLYNKPFADVLMFKTKNITMTMQDKVGFKKYRLPPALNRGVCDACHQPVIGFLPGFGLAFASADKVKDQSILPEPLFHSFYHRRVDDFPDHLPKYSGYWPSTWAVSVQFLKHTFGLKTH